MEQEGISSASGPREPAIVITKDDITASNARPLRQPAVVSPHGFASESLQTPPAEFPTAVGIPAGFWLRLLAKLLDIALSMLFFVVVSVAGGALVYFGCFGNPVPLSEQVRPILARIGWDLLAGYALFYAAYSIVAHAANGRTIGKSICGIRVVTAEGARASTCAAFLYFCARSLLALMSLTLLCVGHVLAGFRKDKRAMHDIVVGSRVVRQSLSDVREL